MDSGLDAIASPRNDTMVYGENGRRVLGSCAPVNLLFNTVSIRNNY
ncbi:hypothetical protein ACVJGD_001526 [Bradyrhizobium sp. USDA 10063]